MTNPLQAILASQESVATSTAIKMPDGLSAEGQKFWRFMNNGQQAVGNEPRSQTRCTLLQTFIRDLFDQGKQPGQRFMETDHGFIQWLFPLETVGVNPQAPVVTKADQRVLRQVDDFKSKLMEHFLLFTEFMGIRYDEKQGTFDKVNAKQWASWIDHPHNNLRISRVLTSMGDFGLVKPAQDLLRFLQEESRRVEPERTGGQVFKTFEAVTQDSCDRFWSTCL